MRKRHLLFVLLTFIFGIGVCNAASISVKASANQVYVGDTFTVTVTVNGVGQSAGSVGAWKYCLDYNSNNLTLMSPASPCINDGVVGLKQASATYTFKANTSAENTISLSGVLVYDYESEQPMDVQRGSANVVASLKDTSRNVEDNTNLSSNANLKLFEVVGYEIVPKFSKDVTNYTLEVPEDVERVQINAFREDATARITPIDYVDLSEGPNKFSVTITAAKGNKKTYTITITRTEANPIKVEVDGKEYNVVNKEEALEVPDGYELTKVDIAGNEVVAYKNDKASITLVVLKDAEGNIGYYMYKDGVFSPYQQITGSAITIVPIKTDKPGVANYDKSKTIKIGDKEVEVYYKDGDEDVVLIYGINTSTGEEGWYYYDTKEGTLFKYITNGQPKDDDAEVDKILKSKNDFKLLTMIFVGASVLALLLILILIICIIRLRKKNEELFKYMEKKIMKHRDKKFNNIGDKDIEKSDLDTFDETVTNVMPEVEDVKEEIIEDEFEDKIDEDIENTEEKTILLREEEIVDIDDDDIIDLDDDGFEDEPKKKKDKEKEKDPTLISDTDILRNIAKANEESFKDDDEPKKLTKKEEKLLKKKEKALAKKAQREFLNDETFEESAFDIYERDETEVIPVVKKKPRTKGRKKS